MVAQRSSGGRQIARGRRYVIWVVLAVLCVLLVQFWAYGEQRWSSQNPSISESRKAFKLMLRNSWFDKDNVDKDQDLLQDPRLLRAMMQAVDNLCKRNDDQRGGKVGRKISSEECRMKLMATHPSFQQPSLVPEQQQSSENGAGENGADQRRIRSLENEVATLSNLLQSSTVFLELKDKRESGLSDTDTIWFMSSIRVPKSSDGHPEALEFPSDLSLGRLLCLMGNDPSDGTENKYGFAWKGHLPANATLLPGLTLVADNYWDYENIWHGMSALVGFVSWRARNHCAAPDRVLLYHRGQLVRAMSSWVDNVLHASFGRKLEVETLEYESPVVCLERAVVNRRGLGKMSMPNLNSMFDTLRCRARNFCGVLAPEAATSPTIRVTILLRTGPRAFKNATAVRRVIEDVCEKSGNCHVEVGYVSNLSFCEQVALMFRTDILVTTHGAQLTNAMFMDKGSSVMELIPKGWLEFAGVGQYIYKWLTEWSNLNHEGYWRDPEGPDCPFPSEDTLKCLYFHKDSMVGHNATHLAEWTQKVVGNFKRREVSIESLTNNCTCDLADSRLR